MAVFYVFQGETYKHEIAGQYLWSPQTNNQGHHNIGYTTMTHVKKGDFILHGYNAHTVGISIAQNDCYIADQPIELVNAKKSTEWNLEGYRIDCQLYLFDQSLNMKLMWDWFKAHHNPQSAFKRDGTGKVQYMCHLADEHAIYILEKAVSQQTDSRLKHILRAALSDIADDKESEYSQLEIEDINQLIDDQPEETPQWSGIIEQQAMTTSSSTGRPIPKRNPQCAVDALKRAEYKCEYNPDDRTFLRKNGKSYTEPHHLIPISKYRDFSPNSLDAMENIVSLCSHCHNLLHYGRMEDKKVILQKLYLERKDALDTIGLSISFEHLLSYYL